MNRSGKSRESKKETPKKDTPKKDTLKKDTPKKDTMAASMGANQPHEDAGGPIDDSVKKLIFGFMATFKTELLETVKKEINESLTTKMNEIEKSMLKKSEEMKRSIDECFKRLNSIADDNKALEKRVTELETTLDSYKKKDALRSIQFDELLEKQLAADTYSRRENLIVYGIPQKQDEKCLEVFQNFMINQLGISADECKQFKFQRCHRLRTTQNPQPLICRFLLYPERMKVWGARRSLKNTQYSLSEDFPQEIMTRRKVLYPIMKAAQNDKKLCRLVADKLVLDSKTYTCKTLHQLPAEYNPANISTVSKNGITAFFTRSSPLSNFYPCDIKLQEHTYTSVEQYLQTEKAKYAGNVEMASQICNTQDPARCKSLGGKVTVDENKWLPFAKLAVQKACRVKFSTNAVAKDYLLKSKGTTLCEAGPDKVWGVGRFLSDPKVYEENEWQGDNLLGKILEAIRDEL